MASRMRGEFRFTHFQHHGAVDDTSNGWKNLCTLLDNIFQASGISNVTLEHRQSYTFQLHFRL